MYPKMVCAIWTRFLCHFQNGASLFCTSNIDEVIKQFVKFQSFYIDFAKIALVTIYMLQTLKTGSHFFHREPNYQLKMFLLDFSLNKVAKSFKMYQILAYFSFYYCKSLNNTFLSWGTPKCAPRML